MALDVSTSTYRSVTWFLSNTTLVYWLLYPFCLHNVIISSSYLLLKVNVFILNTLDLIAMICYCRLLVLNFSQVLPLYFFLSGAGKIWGYLALRSYLFIHIIYLFIYIYIYIYIHIYIYILRSLGIGCWLENSGLYNSCSLM